MLVPILLFIAGLVALIFGAELFLKAVDHFGLKWGISPLIMGLTVVAFATGAPELAISLKAALNGSADLVLGNIIGSNIANILLILGLTTLIAPIQITGRVVRIDVPIVIAASATLYFLARDGGLSTWDGVILLAGLAAYSFYTFLHIRKSRDDGAEDEEIFEYGESPEELAKGSWFYIKNIGLLLIGLALIVFGSDFMVDSAVSIATVLGMSELVIGLTIVSIGTSLPEVATSLSAARKGKSDIAVANVLGSNLYNILLTLGLTLVIAPNVLDVSKQALALDLPFMVMVSVACIPIFWAGFNITRLEGVFFLGYYFTYLTYLVLHALQLPAAGYIETAMLWAVVPLTLVYMLARLVIYKRRK